MQINPNKPVILYFRILIDKFALWNVKRSVTYNVLEMYFLSGVKKNIHIDKSGNISAVILCYKNT